MRRNFKFFNDRKDNVFFSVLAISIVCFTIIYAQDVKVDLDSTHQIIRGFGASHILMWRPDMTNYEIETAFGTEDGQLGFSILRLMIEPDSDRWGLNVATAKKAYDMGATIIAAPWYAPSDMVETVNGISRVRHDRYDAYAAHLDSFHSYMASRGVPVYGVSVQNEPDITDSWTSWTADEMLTFMRENAHAIEGTMVMAPESFHFSHSMTDPILNDPQACANLDIVCGHIYGGGLGSCPLAESKGKEVWMTEHLFGENSTPNDWSWAFQLATEMNNIMNAGMSAYVWWYLVRYYGPIADGTYLRKSEVTKKGYVMSQFARFIRPGYYRLESTFFPQRNVFSTAYRDSISSKVVIVAINTYSKAKTQVFAFENGQVEKLTPYVTSETKNCRVEDDIIVTDGRFTAVLDGESITTFVSGGHVVVDVDDVPVPPALFNLYQNYPNPFNPSTRINFEISEPAVVSLKVYNILGEELEELAGKQFTAGIHSVIFNASDLANGIYFYTLQAGDRRRTKKMFLMK